VSSWWTGWKDAYMHGVQGCEKGGEGRKEIGITKQLGDFSPRPANECSSGGGGRIAILALRMHPTSHACRGAWEPGV